MWQKQRLLNILVHDLPANYDKVAWIDCDTYFLDPGWYQATSEALGTYEIVQPFNEVRHLPPDGEVSSTISSFGY